MPDSAASSPFDAETRANLVNYLDKLPSPILIQVWGDPTASTGEREAARLAKGLADGFDQIEMALLPRRINYPYYPVLGVLGIDDNGGALDFGVRIIGLPAGVQMTAMIAAIQAVAFRATTLEAKTRFQLQDLRKNVELELLSAADDELGTLLAKTIFGLAVASNFIRSYLIMADVFPEALWKYSASHIPHLVVNGRVHASGELDEQAIMRQIATAVK